MMKCLRNSVILIVVVTAIVAFYIEAGIYNIAATEHHWGITEKIIEIFRNRSIAAHSDSGPDRVLDDSNLLQTGINHYQPMCRLCHGAPGYAPNEFSQGLYPAPPSLMDGHVQREFNSTELYWIVEHGIKMSGMPAFGPTHNEEEVWGLVTLVERLPIIDATDYEGMLHAGAADGHNHQKDYHREDHSEDTHSPGHH